MQDISHYTRFRAYQLGDAGASFSYVVKNYFTLIEARYNQYNREHILWEMRQRRLEKIDRLHITSWDKDHCNSTELVPLLKELRPSLIKYPSNPPNTQNSKASLDLIKRYKGGITKPLIPELIKHSPKNQLESRDILYNPIFIEGKSNDNSIIKFFRLGTFTVLSLGDCEKASIRDRLMSDKVLTTEVDVLLLAHHGANNNFTTLKFLKAIKPSVAICAANHNNRYQHPSPEIRRFLKEAGIQYYSTKHGDVIAQSIDQTRFYVTNYISNNKKLNSKEMFINKTHY